MIIVKKGVMMRGMTPQLAFGLQIAHSVYQRRALDMRVTSITEGKHKLRSLHYQGNAADLGTKDPTSGVQYSDDLKRALVAGLRDALGLEWDIVLSTYNIHIEWQPEE